MYNKYNINHTSSICTSVFFVFAKSTDAILSLNLKKLLKMLIIQSKLLIHNNRMQNDSKVDQTIKSLFSVPHPHQKI